MSAPNRRSVVLVATVLVATVLAVGSPSPVSAATTVEIPRVDPLVVAIGGATHHGDPAGLALQGPLVSLAPTPSGAGYWLAGADGGVFAYGDAPWFGSIPQVLPAGVELAEPIVEILARPSGNGYWLVASDGGVFAYGDAPWFGSIPQVLPAGTRLAAPIAAAAPTSSGRGYWLLGADGGVFTFGDARYHGSVPLRNPEGAADAVAIVPTERGLGYSIHLRNGATHAFGDATPAGPSPAPVADADGATRTISATVAGTTSGPVVTSVEPGTGIAALAASPAGGAWLLRNTVGPVATMWQSGGLTENSLARSLEMARSAHAQVAVSHGGAIDYVSARRGGVLVDAAPAGWRIAMSAISLDATAADVLLGGPAARSLARAEVVVGRLAADRHAIERGDTLELYGWNDETVFVTVGHIGESIEIGNVEIAMDRGTAARLGFIRPSAVIVWGFDPGTIDEHLATLPTNERWLTINRSWIPTGRDSTLPTTVLKNVAGEPAYLPGERGDPVLFQQKFIDEHIVPVDLPIIGTIRCHRIVAEPLITVFTAIEAAGLATSIDVADTRAHGGCFYPRTIRGSSGGRLSRHSWGVAIDVNPRTNAFGAAPTIDPRVVEIFRSNGFAWGGSWVRPDGMHFEWTGR